MVVAFVGIGFGDAQSEEGEWEELEYLGGGKGVCYAWEKGVFRKGGGFVGRGLAGSEGACHYHKGRVMFEKEESAGRGEVRRRLEDGTTGRNEYL